MNQLRRLLWMMTDCQMTEESCWNWLKRCWWLKYNSDAWAHYSFYTIIVSWIQLAFAERARQRVTEWAKRLLSANSEIHLFASYLHIIGKHWFSNIKIYRFIAFSRCLWKNCLHTLAAPLACFLLIGFVFFFEYFLEQGWTCSNG